MAEFRTLYYGPMDREYHQAVSETPEPEKLEGSIFPISQLGETVPETDPTGRFKNIIQTTQAAIRGGAGTLQIVMTVPHESAIGGRPKSYGKEVRETLREVAKASEVNIAGVELPTSLNNLAGFDYQNLAFSEEKRTQGLDEVKDAIKFTADVAQGGGVDVVSWEFPRGINEAPWQKTDPLSKGKFFQEGEQPIGWLVDDRTGRTTQFRKTEIQHLPFNKDFTPIKVGPKELAEGKVELNEFGWDDFQKWAEHNKEMNKKLPFEQREPETPEQVYIQTQLNAQKLNLEGWKTTYMQNAQHEQKNIDDINEALKKDPENAALKQALAYSEKKYDDWVHTAQSNAQQAEEIEQRKKHFIPMWDYGVQRSAKSYAEAGIEALRVTQQDAQKEHPMMKTPLHVGPEIGWPGYFGSHPEEFIELVKKSRDEMKKMLTSKYVDPNGKLTNKEYEQVDGKYVDNTKNKNNYFDPNIRPDQAKEMAEKHIKGLFDTGHMGMWLQHFKGQVDPNTGIMETEERRIKRFKDEFYLPAVEKIAKANIVGGLQLVDSMSAAHGHLPPGEGIFPVFEAAKIFKEKGFSGFMVSEGHEEEKFGEGRIRMKTWQNAGAPVGAGYFSGAPMQWRNAAQGYFGRSYSPMFMFGGYSPSNDFKLWSEVPLE